MNNQFLLNIQGQALTPLWELVYREEVVAKQQLMVNPSYLIMVG
jgi:hypothetical protein